MGITTSREAVPARAASSEHLHQLLTTPCEDLPSAIRRYETARDDAASVTAHGWRLLAAELRRLAVTGATGRERAIDRAESCDRRAMSADVFGAAGNA